MEDKDFYELKLISASNQQAIETLTELVKKTSQDVDKLVQTQTDILINQKIMESMKEDITNLQDNQKWTVRSLIGGMITLAIGILTTYLSK